MMTSRTARVYGFGATDVLVRHARRRAARSARWADEGVRPSESERDVRLTDEWTTVDDDVALHCRGAFGAADVLVRHARRRAARSARWADEGVRPSESERDTRLTDERTTVDDDVAHRTSLRIWSDGRPRPSRGASSRAFRAVGGRG